MQLRQRRERHRQGGERIHWNGAFPTLAGEQGLEVRKQRGQLLPSTLLLARVREHRQGVGALRRELEAAAQRGLRFRVAARAHEKRSKVGLNGRVVGALSRELTQACFGADRVAEAFLGQRAAQAERRRCVSL